MNLEELQDALNYFAGKKVKVPPEGHLPVVLDAARLVANPNIEAAHKAFIDFMERNDFPRPHPPKPHSVEEVEAIVAAALTPGDTDE